MANDLTITIDVSMRGWRGAAARALVAGASAALNLASRIIAGGARVVGSAS